MSSANQVLLKLYIPTVKTNCKLSKVIKLGYHALLEARTDWLTIETVFIANHLRVDVDSVAKLSRDVRKVCAEQTEKLVAKAFEVKFITLGDVADAVR